MSPVQVLWEVARGPLFVPSVLVGVLAALALSRLAVMRLGVGVAAATGVAAVVLDQASPWVLAALAALVFGCVVPASAIRRVRVVATVLGLAGLLALLYPVTLWPPVALAVGALVTVLHRTIDRRPLAPLLWLVTLGGVYVTVPNTELAIVAVGASLPVAGTALTAGRRGAGEGLTPQWLAPQWWVPHRADAALLVGMLLVTASGGVPRPASLLGAAGCLGIWLVPWAAGRWWSLLMHVTVVLIASRVAGLQADVPFALAVLGVTLAVAAVACRLMRDTDGQA